MKPLTITVPVSKEMKRELKAIRAGMIVETGQAWTLSEIYSKVMSDGTTTRVQGFTCIDDAESNKAWQAFLDAMK